MIITKEMQELVDMIKDLLPTATDTVAVKNKTWYPSWEEGIEITQEMLDAGKDKYLCDDILWRCIKPHTTQANYRPSINTASIWTAINEGHAGTLEDPIPIPEQLTSFEYEWGLYYLEGSDIYQCTRDGGKPGDKYTLAYKPSQQTPHYFTKVES